MKITERQLRRVIREVIEEVESSQASSDKVQQVKNVIEAFSNHCDKQKESNAKVARYPEDAIERGQSLISCIDNIVKICCPPDMHKVTLQQKQGSALSMILDSGCCDRYSNGFIITDLSMLSKLAKEICNELCN